MTSPAPGQRDLQTAAPASDDPTRDRRGPGIATRTPTRISDWLLNILAVCGVVCIAAVVAAFAFNITLIMFRTGSMSPTIPTGSLAVVREIPASDIVVGDITTVDREGQLPVTHRVTSVEPAGGSTYVIRIKGDANTNEDPHPYVVEHVRKVHWVVPGLGYLVARAQQPWVMALMTVAVAMLVTWAFWPRKSRQE